jgi:hypothetical protein
VARRFLELCYLGCLHGIALVFDRRFGLRFQQGSAAPLNIAIPFGYVVLTMGFSFDDDTFPTRAEILWRAGRREFAWRRNAGCAPN